MKKVGRIKKGFIKTLHTIGFKPKTFSPKSPGKPDDIQLMIVKQSCLKVAIEYHGMQEGGDRSDVIDHAQYFTDWVMDNAKKESKDNNDFPF